MTTKIIVTGTINGKFDVFEKLSKLHAKNDFSLAIALGDFFSDPASASAEDEASLSLLLKGKINIPLPMYFTLGEHALPQPVLQKLENDEDVCENLYFLGKRSTTKTSEGLRIVALGGMLDTELTALSKDKFLPFHTEGDAKSLHGANSADILVTSNWPSSIRSNSHVKSPEGAIDPTSEQGVAELCSALKPRYHFACSNEFFYEREPFFHLTQDSEPDTEHLTRFISMAAFSNAAKQKWLYAFSIDSNAPQPTPLPAGTTASPLNLYKKRKPFPDQEQSFSRFGGSSHRHHDNHHRGPKRRKAAPPGPGECFFCLSNPNLATHLITSIGDDAYLTTAKGPLSAATTYPDIKFPGHILIIPLSHSPTVTSIAPPESRKSTYDEMTRYKTAIQDMLSSRSDGQLGAVTWEVSRIEGIHIHWQFLPVSADMIRKGLVEAAFKVEAENEKYPLFNAHAIGDSTSQDGDYFRVWIWSSVGADMTKGERVFEKELVLPLSGDFRFDLQFGRKVMAKLLGLEKRMQWRDCEQSEEEEKKDAEAFKEAFKSFDFALDDA